MLRTKDTRGDQIIDSRDIIARFDELSDERESLVNAIEEKEEALKEMHEQDSAEETDEDEEAEKNEQAEKLNEELEEAKIALLAFDEGDTDEGEEYRALKSLVDQCEGYGDWQHGETLIRDDYFTEYAEVLASDIGDYNPRNVRWPYTCIDWEKAADELKQDYSQVDFDGTTYWMRS